MSTVRFRRHALACLTAALMLATRSNVWAQQLDTVLTWNQVMATALVVPGANPATVFVSRPIAITGVAIGFLVFGWLLFSDNWSDKNKPSLNRKQSVLPGSSPSSERSNVGPH